MTAVGTIVEKIGAETNGAESKSAGKPNAVVIGSAIMSTATRAITATIVARLCMKTACASTRLR
ncbi:hypothetical protein BK659_06660 [Pseudomonas brassicacearum]|uniref:Uncharacterized protein n=1 Tax=Pseudomonas brassicacearum TaxID=930166 RepID=A0A423H8U2_9PSED|nr:hypothetical protein BK659_06660 [Pseudomonas brassicacearum]